MSASMRGFRFLGHTADVIVEAWGRTLEEAFEEIARGMFEIMTDTSRVKPSEEFRVHVCGFDLENLLFRWLDELLYLHDSRNIVLSEFHVERIYRSNGDVCLQAVVRGETFNSEIHEPRTVVKAVTYHQMAVQCQENLCIARTTFDI